MLFLLCSACLFAQTRRAFLVGISNYDTAKTGWEPVHGANDVALMERVLKDIKITKLVNSRATYARIVKGLETLCRQTKPGDVIYLHFSGHGQPVEDLDGDEPDGWDESFVPYDACKTYKKGKYEGQRHLTDDKLRVYIEKLRKKAGRSGVVYVTIDACHSGDMYRDDVVERGSSDGFSATGKNYAASHAQSKKFGNIPSSRELAKCVMFESCLSTERSLEITYEGKMYGPLSCAIYIVLSNMAPLSTNDIWTFLVPSTFKKLLQPFNLQEMVLERSLY